MSNKALKWCINGCGKQAYYDASGCRRNTGIYRCKKCKEIFTRSQLEVLNTFAHKKKV